MQNKLNLGRTKYVHFIGIGGISMSGLAEILHRDGYIVSGSDWTATDITKHLVGLGINVRLGNDAAYITDDIDLVVYTAAVKPNNPEFAEARKRNITVMDRAKLLGLIMERYMCSIAVAGVHGKTTTTSIIAEVLLAADLDPTISIGGFMEALKGDGISASNFRIGASPYFVLEACEYFDSFLQFYPHIGVILNIDSDHLDYFGTLERLVDSFHRFAKNIPDEGTLVIHRDTPHLSQVTAGLKCNIITYGEPGARFWARDIRYNNEGFPTFFIMDGEETISEVGLKLRGNHNINNALAAAGVATVLGIPTEAVVTGLQGASGAKRRFEHKGVFQGITVIDDYAHHPTEVRASLAAAVPFRENSSSEIYSSEASPNETSPNETSPNKASPNKASPSEISSKRIICAFQSHTYSRTKSLLDEFAAAFEHADIVLILPIYAAREVSFGPYPNYLAELLADGIKNNGKECHFVENFSAAADWIKKYARPGDLLITMGAGDIHILGESLILGDI